MIDTYTYSILNIATQRIERTETTLNAIGAAIAYIRATRPAESFVVVDSNDYIVPGAILYPVIAAAIANH